MPAREQLQINFYFVVGKPSINQLKLFSRASSTDRTALLLTQCEKNARTID